VPASLVRGQGSQSPSRTGTAALCSGVSRSRAMAASLRIALRHEHFCNGPNTARVAAETFCRSDGYLSRRGV